MLVSMVSCVPFLMPYVSQSMLRGPTPPARASSTIPLQSTEKIAECGLLSRESEMMGCSLNKTAQRLHFLETKFQGGGRWAIKNYSTRGVSQESSCANLVLSKRMRGGFILSQVFREEMRSLRDGELLGLLTEFLALITVRCHCRR